MFMYPIESFKPDKKMKSFLKPTSSLANITGTMYVYIWGSKQLGPDHCKPGEVWVPAGENPEPYVMDRAKDVGGYGPVHEITEIYWRPVRNYAEKMCPDIHKPHGRIDDFIFRNRKKNLKAIGFRVGTTGEIHSVSPKTMLKYLDDVLIASGAELESCKLYPWQYREANNVIQAINKGETTFLCIFPCRWSKTIWISAIVREINAPLTVVAAYWLSSHTSFINDLAQFEQFKNIVVVDLSNTPNWRAIIREALKNKKQVVVLLSLYDGKKRDLDLSDKNRVLTPSSRTQRLRWLNNQGRKLAGGKLMFVGDEADYGTWKPKQAKALKKVRKPNDLLFLMSATNGERAASIHPIDRVLTGTYDGMLDEKNNDKAPLPTGMLQHFNASRERLPFIVPVKYGQLDLDSVYQEARRNDPKLDEKINPSWAKFAANPLRAKAFGIAWAQHTLAGEGSSEVNIDDQTNRQSKAQLACLPWGTKNSNVEIIGDMWQTALGPRWRVVAMHSTNGFTNRTAEAIATEEYKKAMSANQRLLLISAGMASRSFSLPELDTVHLCYDEGSLATSIQRMGRVLTPDIHNHNKLAWIISHSLDPNRDSKYDQLILDSARNINVTRNLNNLQTALRIVLETNNYLRFAKGNPIPINEVEGYLQQVEKRNNMGQLLGQLDDWTKATPEQITLMAQAYTGKLSHNTKLLDVVPRGKTYAPFSRRNNNRTIINKEITAARAFLADLRQGLLYMVYATNSKTWEEALNKIQNDLPAQREMGEQFNIPWKYINTFIKQGMVNTDYVQLKVKP